MNLRSHQMKAAVLGRRLRGCRRLLLALPMLLLLFTSAEAVAATITVTGTVNFPDANPDTTPIIGPETIRWRVRAQRSELPWTLTVIADDDLRVGSAVIPANQVSWEGIPRRRVRNGMLSVVTPTLLATEADRRSVRGLMRFYMNNSWDYDVGFYSTTVTFTLSSP